MRALAVTLAVAGALLAVPAHGKPQARAVPTKVGQCATTTIVRIADRFGGKISAKADADGISTGSNVAFANGEFQVSYEPEPAIARSRKGDRVLMCLISIPKGCPPGDDRGRFYTTTNLRTQESWTLPDSQHMCGGA